MAMAMGIKCSTLGLALVLKKMCPLLSENHRRWRYCFGHMGFTNE
jgi:hypothetical protein